MHGVKSQKEKIDVSSRSTQRCESCEDLMIITLANPHFQNQVGAGPN
jgi:hypothetical protein